jgi:F5/8 type C domain
MQKRLIEAPGQEQAAEAAWLSLEDMVQVELTSEDPGHPIEAALLSRTGSGWRAGEPGEQSIRLLFHQPQRLRRIRLRFEEPAATRTQEFALRWSADGGRSFRDLVRQQYTFSPEGSTSEVEDLNVDFPTVTALELTIDPDQGRGETYATLAEWRVA